MANWLNTTFELFDFELLRFAHNMHLSVGSFFDGFMKFITAFGDGGIILILIALALIAFKKTRKIGASMLGAIIIGALITNITIKPLVARPRPFADETSIYYTWWKLVGAVQESEYSFPSGHATASMAAMMAFFLAGNKKYSWTGFILALLVGFSRIYLCVHYPSDVLFGFIVGIVAGSLSYLIVALLYKYLSGTKFGDWVFEKDVITFYNFIKNKYFAKNKVQAVAGDENTLDTSVNDDLSDNEQGNAVISSEEKCDNDCKNNGDITDSDN